MTVAQSFGQITEQESEDSSPLGIAMRLTDVNSRDRKPRFYKPLEQPPLVLVGMSWQGRRLPAPISGVGILRRDQKCGTSFDLEQFPFTREFLHIL